MTMCPQPLLCEWRSLLPHTPPFPPSAAHYDIVRPFVKDALDFAFFSYKFMRLHANKTHDFCFPWDKLRCRYLDVLNLFIFFLQILRLFSGDHDK